jgi:carbon-monoxide dehydrogenase large subunit
VSAFSNAVNDAFAHLGLTHIQMPHDHWRVWKTAHRLGLTADLVGSGTRRNRVLEGLC